jgi:L,D-transpeptidase ErfK/SrfK
MKPRKTFFIAVLAVALLVPWSAWALRSFVLSPDSALYGTIRHVQVEEKDTLLDIAREFGLGYNHLVAANPGVDPWVPAKGSIVRLPLALLLPKERLAQGIVVNLAEMQLYYFFSDGGHDYFITAPTGIGREGYLTELGTFTVKSKAANPTWVVPESIRKEDPSLPASVPPGLTTPWATMPCAFPTGRTPSTARTSLGASDGVSATAASAFTRRISERSIPWCRWVPR